MKKIKDKRIGNAPAATIVKLWDDLYQMKMDLNNLSQKTNDEIYQLMVCRHKKGEFITFLTHQGNLGNDPNQSSTLGAWGTADFINDLAGM